MLVSIVIRTLNESQYLEDLLKSIMNQKAQKILSEVIVVDSGSTDATLEIAESYSCKVLHITRQEFSFGRSLNIGCETAQGDIIVMISGHCVPTGDNWLEQLCLPLSTGKADYTYGRQIGGQNSFYSEKRIFLKYYPEVSKIPQEDFYCNNANSAILKETWEKYRFNEELTGLEDMELAKRLVLGGGKVAYVAEACVNHYHQESWSQVKRRFEREAIALQKIMPEVHLRSRDIVRYIITSITKDWRSASRDGVLHKEFNKIVLYRFWQYRGSYKGNHEHRQLSHRQKEKYFYPY